MPVFPHYSELDERKEEPKWGRPKVMRTSQLLHVIRCGVNVREEDKEEKEDTAVSGHL